LVQVKDMELEDTRWVKAHACVFDEFKRYR
jgi:hypothetical protein